MILVISTGVLLTDTTRLCCRTPPRLGCR
uniref:Uncharacterized protein n=1 Tax=Leersia perrieri TaxID=77586 RepID=A0A0D9V2V3_9ORYZ